MTPILGLIIAIVAARLAPNTRALLTAVLALMVAATAVQSWDLGEGLGRNPPSTIRESGYWVVQAVIISITLTIAYGCFALRRQRAARRGTSLQRANFTGRRGLVATTLIGTLMTVVGVAVCLVIGALRAHNGAGSGNIPWTGVVGVGAGLLVLVGLSVAFVRDNRRPRSGPILTGRSSG